MSLKEELTKIDRLDGDEASRHLYSRIKGDPKEGYSIGQAFAEYPVFLGIMATSEEVLLEEGVSTERAEVLLRGMVTALAMVRDIAENEALRDSIA